ncbi:Swi3-domain-containing protein, partial [Saccharata proteae CBS 121410]
SANLGIDEEITIAKKRQPIAKLDDNRLLSSAGIPKLRKISKERLRFKGKGHEFSDIARLLNMYQLWLDDLYPRAKFADGLAIIEKLGHSKRIQMMRREWINEGKPKPTVELEDNDDIHQEREEQQPSASDVVNGESHEQEHQSDRSDEMPRKKQTPRPDPAAKSAEAGAEEPDEDELDALLAEAESNDIERPGSIVNRNPGTEAGQTSLPKPTEEDPFADEMEAMEGLDD